MTRYDVVIVGSGSAGCVMASRLSEDCDRSVLLIEAGPVYPANGYPADLRDADRIIRTGRHMWGYRSEPGRCNPAFDVAAAKVSGGGSSVNGANVRYGRRDDFDRWTARGVDGWSYEEVMPFYRAVEGLGDSLTRDGRKAGPLPVRQLVAEDATPAHRAFVEACVGAGYPEHADYNGEDQHGIAFEVKNDVDGVRVNAGMVYLTDPVRARPNLAIRDRTQVDRVIIDDARATGVRLVDGEVIEAGEVILCAGAYGSPLILMRSGVGPGADLAALGIPILADLPVGQGLRDHPVHFSTYTLRRASGVPHPAAGAALSIPSKEALDGDLDLWVFVYNMKLPRWLPVRPTLMLGAAVMRPLSRGHVKLRSSDPRDKPIIDVQLLSDPSDRHRMLEAYGWRAISPAGRHLPT